MLLPSLPQFLKLPKPGLWSTLPPELVCKILEHACISCRKTCLKVALISRWSSAIATPILYSSLVLRGNEGAINKLYNNPNLRHTRSLTLTSDALHNNYTVREMMDRMGNLEQLEANVRFVLGLLRREDSPLHRATRVCMKQHRWDSSNLRERHRQLENIMLSKSESDLGSDSELESDVEEEEEWLIPSTTVTHLTIDESSMFLSFAGPLRIFPNLTHIKWIFSADRENHRPLEAESELEEAERLVREGWTCEFPEQIERATVVIVKKSEEQWGEIRARWEGILRERLGWPREKSRVIVRVEC